MEINSVRWTLPQRANAPLDTEGSQPPRDEAVLGDRAPAAEAPRDRLDLALEGLGHGAAPDLKARIRKSLSEGYESLVRFTQPHVTVASFTSLDEVERYSQLSQGKLDVPAHAQLDKLEDKGVVLYFRRETPNLGGGKSPLPGAPQWLRADAAAATILLERGEPIRVVSPDGTEQQLTSVEEAQSLQLDPPAERVKLSQLLDKLEGRGAKLQAQFPMPEGLLAHEYGDQFWHTQKLTVQSGFEEIPQASDALMRRKMLNDLAEGGAIEVTVPGTFRPLVVNARQLEALGRWYGNADQGMVDHSNAARWAMENGEQLFARQLTGDARGQLVACQGPTAAYLTLIEGGEVVLLGKDGVMRGVNSLEQFEAAAYGADRDPQLAQQLHAYKDLQAKGFRFWRQDGPNEWTPGHFPVVLEALSEGGRVMAEAPSGKSGAWLTKMEHLTEFGELQGVTLIPGTVAPAARVDPSMPKKNLLLVYYASLHSPYTPIGAIDDFAYQLRKHGSNELGDIVFLGSDLPAKNNLRYDYIQPGAQEAIAPPTRGMLSDPAVLTSFLHDSILAHQDNEKIRLMVIGHGNGDLGLMDDFTQDGRMHRMGVDSFVTALKDALDQIEQETGKRPVIDNLIMGSCLMGNASFLNALAESGDVKALSASPELMLDNFPTAALTNLLSSPEKASIGGLEYARELVDVFRQAEAFPGAVENRRNAVLYGAYDLDPDKARNFKSALKDFFEVCVRNRDAASYLREDIESCPPYQLHPVAGRGPGSDHRDLIQILRRVLGDARIGSEIKAAAQKLLEATQAQVLVQKGEQEYEGREGPSLFLPLKRSGFDPYEKPPPTRLLQDTGFGDFIKLIQEAAPRTQAIENAERALYDRAAYASELGFMNLKPHDPAHQRDFEQTFLHTLEQPLPSSGFKSGLVAVLRTAVSLVGSVVGLALGVSCGLAGGALLGGAGGLRGHSIEDGDGLKPKTAATPRPIPQPPLSTPGAPAEPPPAPPPGTGTVAEFWLKDSPVRGPVILAAAEGIGTEVSRRVGYKHGRLAGALAGVPTGAVGGAVTAATVWGAVGARAGWELGERLFPSKPQRES